jgi:hypothetical protein
MPAKKQKQPQRPDVSDNDIIIDVSNYGATQPTYDLSGGSIDLGYFQNHADYAAAQSTCNIDTITLPSNFSTSSITAPSTLTWTQSYDNYSITGSNGSHDASVHINTDGVEIKDGGDLKIGDRSMKEFMDKVEDQLAILRPAPELEEKWDALKELRRQYESLKQDILEKEKILKILKEQ